MPAASHPLARDLDRTVAALGAGDLATADRLARRLLKRAPGHPAVLHLGGLVARYRGRLAEAVDLLRRAAALETHNPDLRHNLAECLRAAGRGEEAARVYEKALAIDPRLDASWIGLGDLARARGAPEEAEAAYRRALALAPTAPAAWNGLGLALHERGMIAEAADCWRRVVAMAPETAEAWSNLGLALRSLGRADEAMAALLEAFSRKSEIVDIRRNVASCLKNRAVERSTPKLREAVIACLETPGIDTQTLIPAALGVLADGPGAKALAAVENDADDDTVLSACMALWRDPLFLATLESGFVVRPDWERLLTRLRRAALLAPGGVPSAVVVALAQQSFINEFAFWAEADETAAAERLAASLTEAKPVDEAALARLAMYRPLDALGATLLAVPDAAWSPAFRRFLNRALRAPAEERRLAAAIPELVDGNGDGDDVVRVRAMYEENPYPRWLNAGSRAPRPVFAILAELFPHFTPPDARDGPVRVLIAGCGTGKQAIDAATRYADARVLAVDLSRASLAYGLRMARALGAREIDFRRGDFRHIPIESGPFHVIECTGVLHHLGGKAVALAAWERLAALLAPDGVMKIGLYSTEARRHVEAAAAFAAAGSYPPTPEGVRRLRHDIARLPSDRIERRVLENRDFYAASTCRDLIFHVQAHTYDLDEIAAAIARLDLRFLGFELGDPETVAAYRAANPEDETLTDLGRWRRFEEDHPETFMGMYQFWLRKA